MYTEMVNFRLLKAEKQLQKQNHIEYFALQSPSEIIRTIVKNGVVPDATSNEQPIKTTLLYL